MTRPVLLLFVALACGLVVAACGGSDLPRSAATPPVAPTFAGETLAATPTATPAAPTATATPLSIADLPIIDTHFHPDPAWDQAALVRLLDELGVSRAVGGSGTPAATALEFNAGSPGRFIPFAGQDQLRALYLVEGAPSLNLEGPRTLAYLEQLQSSLAAGCWRGIGELFVNTLGSHRSGALRVPADSPLMRRLWDLSARYAVPLSVHMDADPGSVAEMRRLLDSDADGTWIWAHAGWYAQPGLLRELLQAHPNLHIELSFRDELRSFFAVTDGGRLREEWRALLEGMPDRFLLGTDLLPPPTAGKYSELIAYWRGVLGQLTPATAASLAHENAERLLRLDEPIDVSACLRIIGT